MTMLHIGRIFPKKNKGEDEKIMASMKRSEADELFLKAFCLMS